MQDHLLHSNPLLGLQKALDQDAKTLENLSSCFDCLLNYLETSKQQSDLKYQQFAHDRLGRCLDLVLKQQDPTQKKTQILLILYEVLAEPKLLLDQGILSKFFRILEIISKRLPALKLGDKILPGILVLRGLAADSFGCKWAKEVLRKTERFSRNDYDYYSFLQFNKCLREENTELQLDFQEVLEMIGELSEKMDDQVVQKILEDFPHLLDFLQERFKEKVTNFYQYLRIYINFNIHGKLGTPDKFKEILKVIDSTCKMDSSRSNRMILLDWIPKWLHEFPDQLTVLKDLRALLFGWTVTIQDYLNVLLAEQFRIEFSDSVEFCIFFLHDPKVIPNILLPIELCFVKKAGELKILVNTVVNPDANKDEIIRLAKNATQIFFQAYSENTNRAYKVLAIKSFSDICYLPLVSTTQELDALNEHIQSLILNMTKEMARSERSFCSAFIRSLKTRIILLLFLDSNVLFDELTKIITGSTDYQDLSEFLTHLMKKDDKMFIDTVEQCLSVFISISEHLRQHLHVIKRIVDHIPALFLPVFKRGSSSVTDEKLVIFKTLFQNLTMQILRVAHKWLKEMQSYPQDLKSIVLKNFVLMKTYYSFIKSDRSQMFYLICMIIKWLLVKDDETQKVCLSTSIFYMGSSLLQKEDLVKLSKTLENILPSSSVLEDFKSSYRSFFARHGISFMKEDQNSDPGKSKEKKILEFFPKVSSNTNGNWGDLNSWTELASSALKRKECPSQGSRNIKKVSQSITQKGLSKMDQIKAEIRSSSSNTYKSLEGRKINDSRPVQKPGPDKSPVREKRSAKILDITSLNPVSSTVNVIQAPKNTMKMHDIDQFYRQVLGWNLVDSGASPIPPGIDIGCPKDSYPDYKSYFNSFYPSFLTELWGQLNAEWDEQRSKRAIEMETHHVSHIGDFIDVIFSVKSNDIFELELSENDILILWKGSGSDAHRGALGRVKSIAFCKPETKNVTVNVFLPGFSFIRNNIWSAKKITSLTSALREYQALVMLGEYSLGYQILNPTKIPLPKIDHSKIQKLKSAFEVNAPQAEAIIAATSQNRGFIMIQGPPGTGKTKTILGIIGASIKRSQVIQTPGMSKTAYKSNQNRILCCAPSNAAVDEICRRLLAGIFDIYGKKFFPNIIRFGKASVHPTVQSVTLEALIEKELKESATISSSESNLLKLEEKKNGISREISALHDDRDEIRMRIVKDPTVCCLDLEDEVREINKKLTVLHKSLDEIKNSKERGSAALDKARREMRARLVSSADIILCTLSGSGHEMFSEIRDLSFETVIIDEACQSIEISSLIPLQYGAKKCILVGDPNQVILLANTKLPPTVISQEAQKYLYNQSLFQRFMNVNKKAVLLLNLQYRMHPEISQFPSEYFYDSQLYNGPNLLSSCNASWHSNKNFGAYRFFDISFGREQKTTRNSVQNIQEAIVCAKLVKILCMADQETNFKNKIGIISFYRDQIRPIKTQLNRYLDYDLVETIDVMTVDGFQGQEKDIILLSCVRAGGGLGFITDPRRMNVALTRAKKTMIILGHAETLSNSKEWNALIENSKRRNFYEKMNESWLNSELKSPKTKKL